MSWTPCGENAINEDYRNEAELQSMIITGVIWAIVTLYFDITSYFCMIALGKNMKNIEICQRHNKNYIVPLIGAWISFLGVCRLFLLPFIILGFMLL